MLSQSIVAIPVILDTNSQAVDGLRLVQQWERVFHYGHIVMPAICIGTTSLYAYTAWRQRAEQHPSWASYALATVLTFSMVPFTLLVMAGTNAALFELLNAPTAVELLPARELVGRWGGLHVMRAMFPLAGALCGFHRLLADVRT
jgi:hypothetical protein